MKSATGRSLKTCEAGPGAARRRAGEPKRAPGPAGSLLHLQRTAGNQAVGTLLTTPRPQLQAQLHIGQPGDAFEREADRVADAMAGPAAPRGILPGISQIHGAGGGALRRCARCGGDRGAGEPGGTPAGAAPGVVQRKCPCAQGKDDELMQRREAPGAAPRVPAGFTAQLASLRGAGTPLSPAQRGFFEPRFGHDFSAVRLHTGALAESSADAVHARAFTLGNDVVFGRGEYAPDSPAGRHLLAHELTHVVQQTPMVRRQPVTPDAGDQVSQPRGMDSRQPLRHRSTLPYREATELAKCIQIMGEANANYCREKVLRDEPALHIESGTAAAQKKSSAEKVVVTQPQPLKMLAAEKSPSTREGKKGVEKALSVAAETATKTEDGKTSTDLGGKFKLEVTFPITEKLKLGRNLFILKELGLEGSGGLSSKQPPTSLELQAALKLVSLEFEKVKVPFGLLDLGVSGSLQASGDYSPKSRQLGSKSAGGFGFAEEGEAKYKRTEKSPLFIKLTVGVEKTYDKEGNADFKWSPAVWKTSLGIGWEF